MLLESPLCFFVVRTTAMRPPTFAVLGLLLLSPSPSAAAPHEPARHDPLGAATPSHRHAPRPWRKLSDAIARRIWGVPGQQKSLGVTADRAGAVRQTPGRDLVARYGEDLVLRFTIRSAEEATALVEAAKILFLDVWEFNSNWVDIRIAKDVVSLPARWRQRTSVGY